MCDFKFRVSSFRYVSSPGDDPLLPLLTLAVHQLGPVDALGGGGRVADHCTTRQLTPVAPSEVRDGLGIKLQTTIMGRHQTTNALLILRLLRLPLHTLRSLLLRDQEVALVF